MQRLALLEAEVQTAMLRMTVASMPVQDRSKMYLVGSLFYAIYFFVSFPVFFRIDEARASTSVLGCAGASLAATMLVTLLLDFWRIGFGPITGTAGQSGLPWLTGGPTLVLGHPILA